MCRIFATRGLLESKIRVYINSFFAGAAQCISTGVSWHYRTLISTGIYIVSLSPSIYIKENWTPLSPRRPLIWSSRDFTCEHATSFAWKWSRSDVVYDFLIKVTRKNSLTLTLQQQRRRPAGSDQPASHHQQQQQCRPVQYSKPLLW